MGADCIAKTKRYEKHEEYIVDSDYAIRTGEEAPRGAGAVAGVK